MKIKKLNKKKTLIPLKTDIDKVLGAAQRDQYLKDNPHGYTKVNHVHKNKKKYSRKGKVNHY
ncbi:hypothetical protein [Aureispira anguillae]|uniref:Uncharacterized protein n=1 Tax=Aureispira anguillae TaxID=2864201 RepID=A0A915YHB8_9BACT|nr:hypothetical protein [Aureispira anguillae]BDS13187.1 hypothetical protein AsAng_0039150 [Aureispira anguillae]